MCDNVLRENVKLSNSHKRKLSKYKNYIRQLSKKSTSQSSKKRILQRGGFLGALISPLLREVIGPIVSSFLTNG